MREPLLLQDFGRILEERRSKVREARAVNGSGKAPSAGWGSLTCPDKARYPGFNESASAIPERSDTAAGARLAPGGPRRRAPRPRGRPRPRLIADGRQGSRTEVRGGSDHGQRRTDPGGQRRRSGRGPGRRHTDRDARPARVERGPRRRNRRRSASGRGAARPGRGSAARLHPAQWAAAAPAAGSARRDRHDLRGPAERHRRRFRFGAQVR